MTVEELLRQYEPVLRFVKCERFFPMRVEDYIESSELFRFEGAFRSRRVRQKRTDSRVDDLGSAEDGGYYLRFTKPVFSAKLWFLMLAIVILIVAGFGNIYSPEAARTASYWGAGFLVVMYLGFSNIRIRLFSAFGTVALFIWLIWLPARRIFYELDLPSTALICVRAGYIVFALIFFFALLFLILTRIIPELPGAIFDSVSSATEQTAEDSYKRYAEILRKGSPPTYYGRVVEETDSQGKVWKILQYHYFYAFNDWRFAANGINHHEGDWEMAAVYLCDGQPNAVLYSQHHLGAFAPWAEANRVRKSDGSLSDHPLIYVALGSHANYGEVEAIRSPGLFEQGKFQRVVYFIDAGLRKLTDGMTRLLGQKRDDRIRGEMLQLFGDSKFVQKSLEASDVTAEIYEGGLPMEFATGDGVRIGFSGRFFSEGVIDSEGFLPKEKSDRKLTLPGQRTWNCVLLDPAPAWIRYQGLWGVRSLIHPVLPDESGPPGPKWDRIQKGEQFPNPRLRWEKPLEWLKRLESGSHPPNSRVP